MEQCDYCGHYLSDGECPICLMKCPFCEKNIGEYLPEGYFPGLCSHMICCSSYNYDVIWWRSIKYRRKYYRYSKNSLKGASCAVNYADYVLPFNSQNMIFASFVQAIGMKLFEHKNPFDESTKSSMFLFILENP